MICQSCPMKHILNCSLAALNSYCVETPFKFVDRARTSITVNNFSGVFGAGSSSLSDYDIPFEVFNASDEQECEDRCAVPYCYG